MTSLNMRSYIRPALALVLSLGLVLGSAQAQEKANDPLEPLNRGIFFFNEIFDAVITTPVTSIYKAIVPDPIRKSIGGVFGNLDDVYSGLNHGLQGNGQQAGRDFSRVLINTTLGIGGLFDVASNMGIAKSKTDYGVTLGAWGVGAGPYLVLPVMGPSTLRDTVGRGMRIASDPRTYIPWQTGYSLTATEFFHLRAENASSEGLISSSSLDKYLFTRSLYLQRRSTQVREALDAN
jgi:phospholipid-binding lipoprotein MlaA